MQTTRALKFTNVLDARASNLIPSSVILPFLAVPRRLFWSWGRHSLCFIFSNVCARLIWAVCRSMRTTPLRLGNVWFVSWKLETPVLGVCLDAVDGTRLVDFERGCSWLVKFEFGWSWVAGLGFCLAFFSCIWRTPSKKSLPFGLVEGLQNTNIKKSLFTIMFFRWKYRVAHKVCNTYDQ